MKPRQFRAGALLLALALAIPSLSIAQQNPPPQWSMITSTQIKPEFRAEYEAIQKEITAAYKKSGVPSRIVAQITFGDVMEYVSIMPIAKFADLDGPSALAKALGGEAAAQKMLKRMAPYIVSVHRTADLAMPDVSIQTPADIGEWVQVADYQLLPGKAAEFSAFLKSDYLPAMKKAGVTNVFVSRPIFGGDSNHRTIVIPMKKMAEIDLGPATTRGLGAEGARGLNAKQATMVASVSRIIAHIRMDLSYLPAPPKGTQ
ncbi:MAG TPA: hypothetical protein VGV35_09715 [Bryobacteraceae bacterium]|nr:hypothetical protein [Bryobacteraceae bacterium]